ncbi:transglutaminase-like domain-containing protein [Saccharicrinis aurantiacus]|uniref:transglutaminase-like domain-containing protein n=1 Tax=Saccharicrinis aurantiacus TaxID=1849719 RepID=UPI0009502036|nr:transglutaminase-like domain-containing protein [Saccharicrinis aurantiacus]
MPKSVLTALVLLVLSVCVCGVSFSQGRTVNRDKSDKFKRIYDKSSYVASQSESEFEFVISKGLLTVHQRDKIDYITLKSNVDLYFNKFYNDNIDLIDGSFKYTCGKKKFYRKVFGNYEISNVFYSDAKLAQYSTNLLLEGTEVTFRSHSEYTDPKYLTKVFFQDDSPIEARTISFVIPNNVDVELLEMNFDNYKISKKTEAVSNGKKYTYTCHKLKKLKTDPNSLGFLYYAPHFVVVTKSYQLSDSKKIVIRNVDDLYKWYHSLTEQVIVEERDLELKVRELISSVESDEEQIKAIYYWVQENIKYIAFEDGLAGFIPDEPQNVFAKRYGDCKGMAILTKHMLKVAGFDARLTWVGTNKIPYNYNTPSLAVDNHMICTLNHNGKFYVLDATEKYMALGNNAERIQGKEMLIEDGDKYIRRIVDVNNAISNLIERTETIKIIDDKLIGEGKVSYEGEAKKDILYISTNSKVDDQTALFNYLSVSNYANNDDVIVNNLPEVNRDVTLEVDYTYSLNNKVTNFDGQLFISCDWRNYIGDAIIETDRESDFYFGRKVYNVVNKTIELPNNYKVEYLPEAISATIDDITIQINFKVENNHIIYSNHILVPHGIVKKEYFQPWNQTIKKINEFYNDQIILSKN